MKWLLFLICALFLQRADSCTAFQLKAQDGTWIYGRSLEFSFRLNSKLLIVPRTTAYTATAPEGKPGLAWKTRLGFVGMNQSFSPTYISDGMNERGLIVGALYLPGFAQYEPFDPARQNQTLGMWELPTYLLGTCSTLAEVKEALTRIVVAEQPIISNFVLPLHLYIADQSGAAIVVEYVKGKRMIYDNPLGVLTNSPTFDWHLVNLTNYIHLSPTNASPLLLNQWKVQAVGAGTGLLGLPGDYTPASRFVKAAFFSNFATPPPDGLSGVKCAFHILNTFDIFEGIILPRKDNTPPKVGLPLAPDLTEWVIVHDRTHLKTYFRTYEGLNVQLVDLQEIDFSKEGFRTIELSNQFEPQNVTAAAK
jgi:choloylglycine hydrolase